MYHVNVVIVNYKMREHIDRCLASLFADCLSDGLEVHIVVVDNASGDNIAELLRMKYPTVQCIELTENSGFGHAQNVGLSSTEAMYHFVLNPDTCFYPEQHTLKRLYDFMELHPKVGIVGPKILYPDGSLQYSCYRFPTFLQPFSSRTKWGDKGGRSVKEYALMKDFDHNATRPVDWVMGSAMFVRGVAVKQVGMFDERFWMYYEDSDWCRRMWEAGWQVYYIHDITIEHEHGRGSAKVPGIIKAFFTNKLARVHAQSWLKYMYKWRGNRKYYA